MRNPSPSYGIRRRIITIAYYIPTQLLSSSYKTNYHALIVDGDHRYQHYRNTSKDNHNLILHSFTITITIIRVQLPHTHHKELNPWPSYRICRQTIKIMHQIPTQHIHHHHHTGSIKAHSSWWEKLDTSTIIQDQLWCTNHNELNPSPSPSYIIRRMTVTITYPIPT